MLNFNKIIIIHTELSSYIQPNFNKKFRKKTTKKIKKLAEKVIYVWFNICK